MFFNKFKEEGVVDVVHDSELKNVLIKLNKFEDVGNGKVTCKFTKEIINFDNLPYK